jgi:hypothetical protein
MKIKNVIIALAAIFVSLASVVLLGGALQLAQDTGVSTSDPGFVPSTGQINLGFSPGPPSIATARQIPSDAEARAALISSERATAAFDFSETNGAATSAVEATSPIGASPQTMPAKYSTINDTLDRVPIMAWPLGLSDQQRELIYRSVMADKNTSATGVGNLRPASELSTQVALDDMHVLPSSIDDIAQLRGLKYVKTKDKVFLVVPASRIVVDAIAG